LSFAINPVGPAPNPASIRAAGEAKQAGGFQSAFENAIAQVDGLRQVAGQGVERFLAGETQELHSTVLATQKAELAFELFLQVRNKVVQAYQEVMRMQM
jgi:flagellar hook-basal body complex protein FliE